MASLETAATTPPPTAPPSPPPTTETLQIDLAAQELALAAKDSQLASASGEVARLEEEGEAAGRDGVAAVTELEAWRGLARRVGQHLGALQAVRLHSPPLFHVDRIELICLTTSMNRDCGDVGRMRVRRVTSWIVGRSWRRAVGWQQRPAHAPSAKYDPLALPGYPCGASG